MTQQQRDFRFPFQLQSTAHRVAEEVYERHVAQMVRQVIFTAPGERVNLPEFGCGIRQLLFAPNSEILATTMQFLIFQSLNRWLGEAITDVQVEVQPEPEELRIEIKYVIRRTQTSQSTEVSLSV